MARPTVYHSLLGTLESRIGTMPNGAVLPAEQRLADELKVSKPTLRRALAELARRGLIATENGVGNVVLGARSVMRRELIFLCRDIGFYATTLAAFGAEAHRQNYFLSVVPLAGDRFTQEQIIKAAVERAPSGLVISPDQAHNDLPIYRRLAAGAIPLLFLIRRPEGTDSASLVTIGIKDEVSRVVQRLYDSGCRKFAFYRGDDLSDDRAQERIDGFLDGMRRCRLKPQQRLQCLGRGEVDDFLRQFRSPETAPDAVCCANDIAAAELQERLEREGIDSSRIRFSGFDNLPLSKRLPHPFLTVEPPLEALGDEAAQMITRQIENRSLKPLFKKLPSRLIEW